ncbi:MAG: N-acetylmuramoyl-L-alanine amidase, partial [Acidobacteriota bacterium]
MRRTILLVVMVWAVFVEGVAAQESGELLHFDHQVSLGFEVGEPMVRKRTGSVIGRTSVSEVSRQPFSRILVNGMLPDSSVILEIRTESVEGQWSDWAEMRLRIFENGRFWGRMDLVDQMALRMQIRLVNGGMTIPGTIEIFAVEVDDGGRPSVKDERSGDRVPPPTTKSDGTIEPPSIVSRDEWGASPPVGSYIPHDPYRFAQHHTAGMRIQTLDEGMAEMRFIQDFHQNGQGWQDIGYHYCIDDAGRIYEGVPPDFRGTHTGGNNTGNIGISLFGNYDVAGEHPTQASLDSLVAMWSWLAWEYEVNPDRLYGHRDYTSTACPGENFYSRIEDMRNGVRKALAFGAPYVADPLPQPFSLGVPPGRGITFSIRDDEEGVDLHSIVVRVNNEVVAPNISGGPDEYFISYTPPAPFPSSQNVVVEVAAMDFAAFPNSMLYTFGFTIEVEALHVEVAGPDSMSNADLELSGSWSIDGQDADLGDLVNGDRLLAVDDDGSHRARVFPAVQVDGDYRVLMAVGGLFLGESAHYRFVNASGVESRRFVEYNGVFDEEWGTLSPTPIHFDTGGQSLAFVELSGLDGL